MNNLKRKLEGEAEIRASSIDVLHEIIKSKPHHASNIVPHFIQGVDLRHGDDHGSIDSLSVWNYTLGGESLELKTVLEEADDEKKYIKYRIIEGNMMNKYKSLIATCQMISKANEPQKCIAKLTLEYEKMHVGIPEPSDLLDSLLEAWIHIDDHHHGINK